MYPMNKNELTDLIGRTVIFNERIEDTECGMEKGMIAVIKNATHNQDAHGSDDDGVFLVHFDFGGKHLQHNLGLMSSNYYDEVGNPRLKWSETKFFPKNHVQEIYLTYGTWHKRHAADHEFTVLEQAHVARVPDMCVSLIDTIAVNVNNKELSDADFRTFIRNSLPVTVKV